MFTPEETALNRAEGWELAQHEPWSNPPIWMIQRIRRILGFDADIEAFHYCKCRAYEGSERHQRAINAHGNMV